MGLGAFIQRAQHAGLTTDQGRRERRHFVGGGDGGDRRDKIATADPLGHLGQGGQWLGQAADIPSGQRNAKQRDEASAGHENGQRPVFGCN